MYKIKTSERNNDKATEFETKSLLYLLTKIKGHSKVDLFIIDCFNDVTGVSSNYRESWDVQSKGVASLTPRTVGVSLYTLFINYTSDIDFSHYILFLPPLKDSYIENSASETFDITNIKETKYTVKDGLLAEIIRRNDPDVNTTLSLLRIDEFLEKVTFIVDKYEKVDYIRSIIEFKNVDRLDDTFLTRIFDEVRVQQATKKIRNVYGEEVIALRDAERFNKTIYRKDIELLVVNRVIGNDIFSSKGVPVYFVGEVQGMEEEDVVDLIQECQARISRTLFNKNNKKAFWRLLEAILELINNNRSLVISDIAKAVNPDLRKSIFTLDDISLLYLIALIKEGLKNENP